MKETEKKTKKKYKRTDAPKGQVAQIKRIQHIHNQIANNKFPNCKSLAKELDVSEMTIHRDMDKLRDDFKAPIEFNYTENGFHYYELYEFTLQKTLEENELQLLTEAKIFLSHFKNTPVYEGMEKVLDSFCANRKYEKDDDLLLRRIALAPSTEPRVHINPKTWEDITEALKKIMFYICTIQNQVMILPNLRFQYMDKKKTDGLYDHIRFCLIKGLDIFLVM